MTQPSQKKKLILKGGAVAYIDWANVHGWETSLKREIDIDYLFAYLKTYPEIKDTRLYFGKDIHPKSAAFLERAEKAGYAITTKPVKYIVEAEIDGKKIYRRKCDFDMEMCISGKQVIVVYSPGHLGREVWDIKRGLFKIQIKHLLDV